MFFKSKAQKMQEMSDFIISGSRYQPLRRSAHSYTEHQQESGRSYMSSARAAYYDEHRPVSVDRIRYAKCPYCGNRQDIKQDGANCISCAGDVLNKEVG